MTHRYWSISTCPLHIVIHSYLRHSHVVATAENSGWNPYDIQNQGQLDQFAAAAAINIWQSVGVGTPGKSSALLIVIHLTSLVLCEGVGVGKGVWRQG